MASERPAIQILVALIGVAGVIVAAYIARNVRSEPTPTLPPPVVSEEERLKEIVAGFDVRFSSDRRGGDYANFDLVDDKYALCAKACAEDVDCRSFVYTPRGHEGPRPRCWLKSIVPDERAVPGFISGVKR